MLSLSFICSFSVSSYAEVLKGEIQQTPKDGSSFQLNLPKDTGQKQELQIWLSTETKFKGLSSLLELVKGDEVTVTAQKNVSNNNRWEADLVELSKVVIRNPGPEVSVPKEIVKEKVDRAQAAEIPNQDFEMAGLKNKFENMEKEIESLRSKAAGNPDNLQEETDVLLTDLLSKKLLAKSKLSEYQMTDFENKDEVFKSAYLLMTDFEESLLRVRQELVSPEPAI